MASRHISRYITEPFKTVMPESDSQCVYTQMFIIGKSKAIASNGIALPSAQTRTITAGLGGKLQRHELEAFKTKAVDFYLALRKMKQSERDEYLRYYKERHMLRWFVSQLAKFIFATEGLIENEPVDKWQERWENHKIRARENGLKMRKANRKNEKTTQPKD